MKSLQSTLAAAGLAGSALVAVAAPRALSDPVVHWWYSPGLGVSRATAVWLVYAGMAIMCCAWLCLGRVLPSRRALLVITALWALPLALAPPLFSRDIYSYLAQGTILHLGHNPYHTAPSALAALHRPHVLAAVSPFWRGTTAPYGPLFLGLVAMIVGAVGSHLVAGVLLVRALELIGLLLVALCAPRLARALGSDERRALWLVAASPLVMLQLVAAGHNDLLMAGLLAVGLVCALNGWPLAAVAICALAATIKLPAIAAAGFIAVAWFRAERGAAARLRFAVAVAAIAVVVLGAVTLATGAGVAWVSSSLFSTPARVRLAITPATGIGYTIAVVLKAIGVAVSSRSFEGVFVVVASVLAATAGGVLLWRVRVTTVAKSLGTFLVVAAACGPAAWPWYFVWGLVALAALAPVQRSYPLAIAIAASSLVVKPNGILELPLGSAPAVLAVYVAAAALAIRSWRRRSTALTAPVGAGASDGAVPGGSSAALARTS